jgi:hypothetical protein
MTSNTTGVMTLTNGNKINVQRFVFNTEPVAAEIAKNLLISEVSSDYYSNGSTWFEVYNPNATTASIWLTIRCVALIWIRGRFIQRRRLSQCRQLLFHQNRIW